MVYRVMVYRVIGGYWGMVYRVIGGWCIGLYGDGDGV